jgi:hypothetical protein
MVPRRDRRYVRGKGKPLPTGALAIFQNSSEARIKKAFATAEDAALGGFGGRRLVAACNRAKMMPILRYLLDENEFFGPDGIRLLSRYHRSHPIRFCVA